MRELIPGLGKRKARKRIDELFSRQTLGAVLFGAAASKIVEKVNTIMTVVIIIYVFGIDVTADMWIVAILLLMMWSSEFILFIYLYIKWEQAMKAVDEGKEKVKDKASETAEKAKNKASEVKEKAESDEESNENQTDS